VHECLQQALRQFRLDRNLELAQSSLGSDWYFNFVPAARILGGQFFISAIQAIANRGSQ
jgi:hypothetical protein